MKEEMCDKLDVFPIIQFHVGGLRLGWGEGTEIKHPIATFYFKIFLWQTILHKSCAAHGLKFVKLNLKYQCKKNLQMHMTNETVKLV